MNAGKDIYEYLIAERLKRWHDLVLTPLINRAVPTAYARRQFRTLLRRHPQIAAQYGFTEESVMDLPPRVLETFITKTTRRTAVMSHAAACCSALDLDAYRTMPCSESTNARGVLTTAAYREPVAVKDDWKRAARSSMAANPITASRLPV
jgi:hypothetical protein